MGLKMSLKKKIKSKINDKVLYENLKTFASAYKVSKANAYAGYNFDELRAEVNEIKEISKEKALTLFEEFKKNAEKSGAYVFQATDANQACKYIQSVCEKHNAEYVVKSKSMTSEEIKLNDYLEKRNIKPVETDLGEWILQLAGEHPSHMVLPAIHKTRGQVAEIFSEYTGDPVDKDDIEGMVKIARKSLRDYYFKAKVGITGANIAVASTGAIATLTNEGNARLSNTVPPVHIVLLGYEKLVEDFDKAMKIVRVLPRSATGQTITTYVTWVKGQNPSFQSEDGKKEIHFVFLDNGRLSFFDHPLMNEALKCIRCGSCANVCPAYEMIGGHVFGHIYTGAIGLIMTALFHGSENAKDILKLCIGCKSCSNNCPSGIDLQRIIFDLKAAMGDKYGINPVKKAVFSNVLPNPTVFKSLISVGRLVQKPLLDDNGCSLKKIPLMPKDKDFRKLPAIAEKSFSESFRKLRLSNKSSKKKVFFYQGCAIEYFYPEMGLTMCRILDKAGFGVDIPDKSVCCGLPAIASGDRKSADKSIFKNIPYMKNPETYSHYLTLCPSCGIAVKENFPEYTVNNPDLFKKADKIKDKVISFGEFLENENIKFKIAENKKVTYHSPCHLKRGMDYSAENLLKNILGDNFIEMTDSDVCCGFGGSYSIDFAEISSGILDKKLHNIKETGADIVVTDCPGCVMQIKGGADKNDMGIEVIHLSEFIDNYLEPES